MLIQNIHTLLRAAAITGFAGYGAATLYGSNPRLATQIGIIYALGQFIFQKLFWNPQKPVLEQYKLDCCLLSTDVVLSVACRAFNLIGNKGFILVSTYSLARFAINRNFVFFPKKETKYERS